MTRFAYRGLVSIASVAIFVLLATFAGGVSEASVQKAYSEAFLKAYEGGNVHEMRSVARTFAEKYRVLEISKTNEEDYRAALALVETGDVALMREKFRVLGDLVARGDRELCRKALPDLLRLAEKLDFAYGWQVIVSAGINLRDDELYYRAQRRFNELRGQK